MTAVHNYDDFFDDISIRLIIIKENFNNFSIQNSRFKNKQMEVILC